MNREDVIKNYFHHLENGNYQEVVGLFSESASVVSPLYGARNPSEFYQELFSDTDRSKINLKNIFISVNHKNTAAAHFFYNWTMRDGSITHFECVDVFELNNENKIIRLTIIYDTYQTRLKFDALKGKDNGGSI